MRKDLSCLGWDGPGAIFGLGAVWILGDGSTKDVRRWK
jgi:hypothetical protein